MSRQLTFVVLDEKSERGALWQRITGKCSFEATIGDDGWYRVAFDQFDDATLGKIFETLAERFHATPAEVGEDLTRLGFIPLKPGPDASFGADLRMVL